MLTKEQRIRLRSFGQKLPDIVYIGKDDLNESVIKQINDNLYAYELIKIKVQNSSIMSAKEIAPIIENECGCEVVTVIGSKILVYKKSSKKTDKRLEEIRKIIK